MAFEFMGCREGLAWTIESGRRGLTTVHSGREDRAMGQEDGADPPVADDE